MARMGKQTIGYAFLGLFLLANVLCGGYLLFRTEPKPAMETVVLPAATAVIPVQTMPAVDPPHAPVLVIKKALYGDLPAGAATDVTVKVAGMVQGSDLAVDASNDNFGDPAEGIEKTLRVDYTRDGVADSVSAHEGDRLRIHLGLRRLVIKKALYGDLPDGHCADVTIKVAELVDNDELTVEATNDNFGDPAENIVKALQVEYTFDGQEKSKSVHENETLTISGAGE